MPRNRRSLLKLFGAAVVGAAGGGLARGETASADDGSALLIGQPNTGTQKTALATSGAIANDGAFVVNASAADWAVEGSSGQLGVLGSGFIGVMGTGDIGGFFSGNLAAISLQPQDAAGAPTSGDYSKGDVLVDSDGVLYLCVAAGNPGTWIKVSHVGTRLLTAANRAYDSRPDQQGGDPRGLFAKEEERLITLAGNFGIPANAVGVIGNIAVTATDVYGNALAYPAGITRPNAASINWFGAGQTLNNALTVKIGSGGAIVLYAAMPTHIILDVSGYIL